MASRSAKKLCKKVSKSTKTVFKFKGLINDLPTEILWKILHQTAILSSVTRAGTVKVNLHCENVVLQPLASVCRLWKDVVSHTVWRTSYFNELMALDPTCKYRRSANPITVNGLVRDVVALCVFGDELFAFSSKEGSQPVEIHVYTISALDEATSLRRQRRGDCIPTLGLKRILRPGLEFHKYVDLQSCKANGSLYINFGDSITCISPADGRVLGHWSTPTKENFMSIDDPTGCVVVSDWASRRLLIYSDDGKLARSIDVSRLLKTHNERFNCFAVDTDPDASAAAAAPSSFILIRSDGTFIKFRVLATGGATAVNGDEIESLIVEQTLNSGSRMSFRMLLDSRQCGLTLGMKRTAADLFHVFLSIVDWRSVTRCRYVSLLTAYHLFNNRWHWCLDRDHDRIFVSFTPRSYMTPVKENRLVIFDLQRDGMKP